MPVRVLWVIKGLGPGGAETLLANAAAVHDRSAFHIECVFVLPSKDHLAERLEVAGVRTTCVSRRERDWRWPFRLARHVRAGGYHVVHVHSPLPASVARLATRTMGKRRPRLVTTEHNAWGTFRLPTRCLNRLTSRWDDVTFTVSDEVRQSLRGRAARRAVTLTHGIDVAETAALRSERARVRAEFGIGRDDVVIGTVANFREQKDYPTLLHAAKEYLDRGYRARWLIVGQGPLERETRALATRLGLDDHVHFTGFRADAARVQSAFDVFTLSSKWEGLPVALMEALAIGVPIVATAVGGVAETLVDGESALLVPAGDSGRLADAWQRVAADAELHHRLGAAARALAPAFDIRRAQSAIEGSYLQLCPAVEVAPVSAPAARPPRRPNGLDIRPLTDDDEPAVLQLLGRSLGWNDDPRFRDLFRWKHVDNAFGPSFGWVATDAGRIIGVRLFMRWNFVRGGETLHAVRAVDTATDPDYQGRGLFTALTMHGLDEIRHHGVDFVFNMPNAQSKPGYLKMGWREVGHVPASVRPTRASSLVRLAGARTPADHWSEPLGIGMQIEDWLGQHSFDDNESMSGVRSISTAVDRQYLQWRYGMPHLHYRVLGDTDEAVVVRTRRRGPALELVVAAYLGGSTHQLGQGALAAARAVGADHVLHAGRHAPASYVRVPLLGPVLTWRAVRMSAMPPIDNWALQMGDIELM